jgi:hypothetical protein
MGDLLASSKHADEPVVSDEVANKLMEVEILYILASRPAATGELVAQLKGTFGLETDSTQVGQMIEKLDTLRWIRKFSSFEADGSLSGSIREAFSITPMGLAKLGGWIESLSEIALTMQLGLHQRVVVDED